MTTAVSPSTACAPSRTPARAPVACSHCGLDVPPGLIEDGAEHQFCCGGCRSVYSIINAGGLTDYYGMRRSLEKKRARVNAEPTRYDAFDDPSFVERYTRTQDDGSVEATLVLEGLHCAACVWLSEHLPRVVPGVLHASVSFTRARVEVRWDPAKASLATVARGLHELGYPASPPRAGAAEEARRVDARRQLVRIGVAGAIAGNVMLVSIALYAGVFDGIEERFFTLFRWIAAGLTLLSLAWPGRVFFRGAINAIRTRTAHLDLPIGLALAVGAAWGLANTVRGTGEIYFDSIATLVFALLVGRFLQASQQRRAAESVDLLLSVAPSTVRLVDADGSASVRPIEAANVGDTAHVDAGETFAIDGTVLSGESDADLAILTGESAPVAVAPGDPVYAGAVNLSGPVRVRIDALGESTRAASIMRLVTDAMASKPPIVQMADRAAGWFVLVVTTLAIITTLVWWSADPNLAIEHATALLIVTCPCALGLATPLVLSAAIGRLARRGILVKGGEQLEHLARSGVLVLDKTGTLTTGRPRVAEWTVPDDVQRRVRTLEASSTHPIAKAIADSGEHDDAPAVDIRNTLARGVQGVVSGRSLVVGSPTLLDEAGVTVDDEHRDWADARAAEGSTPVLIAEDGRSLGGVALVDDLREDAGELISDLRDAGWRLEVLSGDDERVVRRTAETLGIDPAGARGRVSPEGKLDRVRRLRGEHGPVVMVGDGVNDAAALAAADVGIAAQGGADASLDAADVSISRGGLESVGALIGSSRTAIGRIRMCMGVSLTYNAIAASLAMAGVLTPLLAAIIMPISSITVVTLAGSTPSRSRLLHRKAR